MKAYFSILLAITVYLQSVILAEATSCCYLKIDPEITCSCTQNHLYKRSLCCNTNYCDKTCEMDLCTIHLKEKNTATQSKLNEKEKIEKLHNGAPVLNLLDYVNFSCKTIPITSNLSLITTLRFFPLRI